MFEAEAVTDLVREVYFPWLASPQAVQAGQLALTVVSAVEPGLSNNPEAPIEAGEDTFDSETEETSKPGVFRRIINRVSQMAQAGDEQSQDQGSQGLSSEPPIELIFAYHPDPGPLFDEKGSPQFPIPLIPLCSLTFSEEVHPEAIPVIKSLSADGIEAKIFTADYSEQAVELLKDAGLRDQSLNTISGTELSGLDTDEFVQAAAENGIFQQLTPEQMGLVVASLRASGQYVALVGDTVNDEPALSQANLAVTYQSSSQAAQSMADILVLENSLQVLERVLDKGQRIVNGLLDILKLYLTQVSYLALLILAIQIIGFGFPLHGIQLTVITIITITIPGLGLTLWANPGVLYGKNIRKSLGHFVVPAAITIAIAGAFSFHYFRTVSDDWFYAQLADTYILVFTGLLVVLFLRPPFRILAGGAPASKDRRIFYMVVALTGLFFLTLALSTAIPFLQDLLKLDWLDSISDFLIVTLIVVVWAFVLLFIWHVWRLDGIWNNQQESQPCQR